MNINKIEKAVNLILKSKYTIVYTGAGISAESGIPTLRGKNGFWMRYDPNKVASIKGFLKDPKAFWLFAKDIAKKLSVEPNKAHYVISKLEDMGIVKKVITQNIDGLHQKAGSKNVIELHGSLKYIDCLKCGRTYEWQEILKILDNVKCKSCGSLYLKPRIVFFGENLPISSYFKAVSEAERADLVLVIGSSLTVYPATYILDISKGRGAKMILINKDSTYKDHIFDLLIFGKAIKVMKTIIEEIKKQYKSSQNL